MYITFCLSQVSTFQIVMISNGHMSFAIMNYGDINFANLNGGIYAQVRLTPELREKTILNLLFSFVFCRTC